MNTTEQQFSQLVRDNRSTIYAVCYMFSNDADEVADLFQEVLVKLWNGYETFHGKSDVKTWIYRVTLNTCITIDRKKRSRRKALLSMDVDYFNDEEKSTPPSAYAARAHSPTAAARQSHRSALARANQLRRDRRHRGPERKERLCASGANKSATEEYVKRIKTRPLWKTIIKTPNSSSCARRWKTSRRSSTSRR